MKSWGMRYLFSKYIYTSDTFLNDAVINNFYNPYLLSPVVAKTKGLMSKAWNKLAVVGVVKAIR